MYCISISHKSAPVEIRELFSFSMEEEGRFSEKILQNEHITECVVISTCNRAELYFCGDNHAIHCVEQHLAEFKGIETERLLKYFLIFEQERAVKHLFMVACGMDSMLLGEDEILGQVRGAYERALEKGTTNYELNTLFQAAISCAKKIKTDTKVSKTPVSIATLAANEILRYPGENKTVLMIGLSGKMGGIIYKNIYGRDNLHIIGTTRNHCKEFDIKSDQVTWVDYHNRYDYVEEADIIVSATTSPHYTITFHEVSEKIKTDKQRLFIDLSVPTDIDQNMVKLPGAILYDIDHYRGLSETNNAVKQKEMEFAGLIMEERMEEVMKEIHFHDFLSDLARVRRVFETKRFDHVLYELRDLASEDELIHLLKLLRKLKDAEEQTQERQSPE